MTRTEATCSQGRDADQSADLREMQRAVGNRDGARRLLRWLAYRVDGGAALLDGHGRLRYAFPGAGSGQPWAANAPDETGAAAPVRPWNADVQRVLDRRIHSCIVDAGPHKVHAVAMNADAPGPALLVSVRGRTLPGVGGLLADAARLLDLRWRAEEAERRYRTVAAADARVREAVLHLLMAGALDSAGRVAAALTPRLPDQMRVLVVECPPDHRDAVARRCTDVSRGAAWVVRCPVYERHLIILAPTTEDDEVRPGPSAVGRALRELAAESGEIRVGEGLGVPLHDTPAGYEQAFHALAKAGADAGGHAVFDPLEELSLVLGARAHPWARAQLGPLLDYLPERRQDPGGRELIATLRSWLDFRGGTARQLKLHRNTVSGRLRRIEELLGLQLSGLDVLARLHLALRILADHRCTPVGGTGGDTGSAPAPAVLDLDELLSDERVGHWADTLLRPLTTEGPDFSEPTLRAWLERDAVLEDTATALGVSVSGARKRLLKLERVLGRSLLNGPSARYDLAIAVRATDLREGRASAE
ncbi:helix-turn-helix domain-containing protein [Nocardiopsis potens]|uniref:helix-turn-helix domain-containing protein n=1 Tax=Nocardiopsis potens TaxID=1246458 RepID=UPI00034C4A32|nr:helix-turn-helix domain-containing protein [Nocardiopsis potens]